MTIIKKNMNAKDFFEFCVANCKEVKNYCETFDNFSCNDGMPECNIDKMIKGKREICIFKPFYLYMFSEDNFSFLMEWKDSNGKVELKKF